MICKWFFIYVFMVYYVQPVASEELYYLGIILITIDVIVSVIELIINWNK